MGFDPLEQRFQRLVVETAQHQNLRPRQQRTVQFERRILRRGADQDHRSVFHHRKKTVLLAAVEAVDFVDEEQRALPDPPALARGFEGFLQIGDAGKHRRQLFEMKFKGVRKKPRDRGFAGAGRTP